MVQQGTGLTSTSLDRAPAPQQNFVRGKSSHVPFWPGGLDEVLLTSSSGISNRSKGLRTVPPGFSRGLRIGDGNFEDEDISALDSMGTEKSDQSLEVFLCCVSFRLVLSDYTEPR